MNALRDLFSVNALPVLQNRVYPSAAAAVACPVGDVVLAQDAATGLVFNRAFDPALLVYDADYQNEQAVSGAFRRHLEDVLGLVGQHFHGQRLIEVGCGKGYFLERLRAAGYDATGIDPAYEGDSPHVIRAPFEAGLGLSADAIVLRHVLEHMADPLAFLRTIAAANGGRGLIYIEVPCFDWICQQRAWFDVFYEHVNYFRADDFRRLFGRVIEQGRIFGDQYLYVVADLASLREPVAAAADAVHLPADFTAGIERSRQAALAARHPVAVWGGSSKGVIFARHLQRAGIALDLAIDINPAKQGRYMPATGLQIVSPQAAADLLPPGSLVFVMNSNYFDEIVAQSHQRYEYLRIDHHEL